MRTQLRNALFACLSLVSISTWAAPDVKGRPSVGDLECTTEIQSKTARGGFHVNRIYAREFKGGSARTVGNQTVLRFYEHDTVQATPKGVLMELSGSINNNASGSVSIRVEKDTYSAPYHMTIRDDNNGSQLLAVDFTKTEDEASIAKLSTGNQIVIFCRITEQ